MSEAGFKLGNSDTSNALMETNGFTRVILFYLLVPLFVPFIEEMFFRGAIMHSLFWGFFMMKFVVFDDSKIRGHVQFLRYLMVAH